MSLRAIQQFVIHVQSFRNIDLWYQGAYLLQIQLYKQMKDKNLKQKVYAHPFAFTEEHLQNNCQAKFGDTQIIKKASISNQTSSFLTKAYLLKYYEQQVQINDIVHFRIQTDISFEEDQFILQFNLLFFDQQIKKLDPDQITLQKAKITKTKKYFINNSKKGIHEYIPLMFQGQYFSIANIVIHTLCVDYRYRLCPLQLYQFSKLSTQEKKKLLQKNKKISCKEIDYFDSITHTLKLAKNFNSIQQIQQILIKNFKKSYKSLLKQYRNLFSRVITSYHKQYFSHLLINPNDLGLYEDEMPLNNSLGWQQKIELKYKSKNLNMIIQNMLNETNLIAGQLLKLWHYFIDIIKISPRFTYAHYEDLYMKSKQILWNKFRRVTLNQNKFLKFSYLEQHEEHMKIEKQLIADRNKLILETDVVSQQFLSKKNNLSLMIQDVYGDYSKKESEDVTGDQLFKVNNLHLVVLVHGFQGNSIDMKLIKNNCSFFYPEVAFLCSSANQQLTDTDIIQMGNRLANEIRNYISQYFPPDSLERISFIGHSLGGVIIRAALPKLLDMKQKFHTLITFSSPHLGYKVNASSVIEAGIWFLQKFKNSNCLKQLTLGDNTNLKQTTLYKISKFEGLKYFKDIFLFSSKQDSYAPFQSARIQIHPQFMNTKDLMKQIHCEMVNNILNDISPKQMHRIIVNFTIQETNLDSLIGRTAHILFLQNSQLIQMFLMTHPDIFA